MEKSFRQISLDQRLEYLEIHRGLSADEMTLLRGKSLPTAIAENLIENAIGYFQIPLGIATHFVVDGREYLIPMAVEESSIVAAASATAKWIRSQGEITTHTVGKLIIGQIQLPRVKVPSAVKAVLESARKLIIQAANQLLPGLVARGGGVERVEVREVARADGSGTMLVIHLLCDPCDAMGANLINQVCEGLKPLIEELTGETVGLCILSNLVDGKCAAAEVVIRDIDPALGLGICEASLFAESDPYRAATHNKGILNGVDPILIATGNDWRAVEAGAHAYASRTGTYKPLSSWKMRGADLIGRLEMPLALGIVGGVTRIHPAAQAALKILEITSSEELARICAAVGLVQNLGALRALSTVGIVRGHMELHASNLALAAGSNPSEVLRVRLRLTELLKQKKKIGITVAREILMELRAETAQG
jgi:hydroxymethylglutaryl-CoA reductase